MQILACHWYGDYIKKDKIGQRSSRHGKHEMHNKCCLESHMTRDHVGEKQ
jgi:hypothetical protein